MLKRCRGLTPVQARKIVGAHSKPKEALGFWTAAVRELFEEAGILLAANDRAPARSADLNAAHAALLAGNLKFSSFLANEKLACDLSGLIYFSRWQTPSRQSMRYETLFFLALTPEGQSPLPTSPEATHSVWLSPDRALQLFAKNELPMIFPTFSSLRRLADFDSLESLLREYRPADA
jgi:8-oxo-dGTP pyrophosphatase MutT (NUDIX family)